MGDRCFMLLTCRKEDVPVFEKLGFLVDDYYSTWKDGEMVAVSMFDDEANYAHYGDMPSDIPYYGNHSTGDDYPEGMFACCGEGVVWVNSLGGEIMVPLNLETLKPDKASMRRVRLFKKTEERAMKMLGEV